MSCCTFKVSFRESEQFNVEFGETTTILPDPYLGEYEATPSTDEQIFPTAKKSMSKDFTVKEIPYARVANMYGETVSIAS